MVWLVEALSGKRKMSEVSNLIYKDEEGQMHVNETYQERVDQLPPPDFDGMPWDKYFTHEKLVPYLGTRGCYWGKCTFCDHGAGYIDQFRAKHADQILDELEYLKNKLNVYADICRQLVLRSIKKQKPEVVGISIGTPVQLMSLSTVSIPF